MNKPKILDDEEAFKATEGRRIAVITHDPYSKSIEIKFTDGSHITIEMRCDENHCNCGPGEPYCYCTGSGDIQIDSYFSEGK